MVVLIGFVLIIVGFSMLKDKTAIGLTMLIFGTALLSAIAEIY